MKTITICMGSSCFSRGNGKNYEVIKKFVTDNNLDTEVSIKGCRCGGQCTSGPTIWIEQEPISNLDPGTAVDVLKHHLIPVR